MPENSTNKTQHAPKPLLVLNCVGLTSEHIGDHTPNLKRLAEKGSCSALRSVIPAVTTSAQVSMLTGEMPNQHGIVANGWYFRGLNEVWLWRQSETLQEKKNIWEKLQAEKNIRVLKHFWWYAMNSSADAMVTPRPAYHADGAKSPDIYAWPQDLKQKLIDKHGAFPLFKFWGPTANIESSAWICESCVTAWRQTGADLCLCYVPHLDYDLQRLGPEGPHLAKNLHELDTALAPLLREAEQRGAEVLVVSEYAITAVDKAVAINRKLREWGYLEIISNATGSLLDFGKSKAFAVCDHQLAHVYCHPTLSDAEHKELYQKLQELDGISKVYFGAERAEIHLDHERSGDIIALSNKNAWFQYEYWLENEAAPDFAHQVEIHKKPGYDPRELFFDPQGGKPRAFKALAKKLLGLRYVMNPVSLDPSLVKGSHGLAGETAAEQAICLSSWKRNNENIPHQCDIASMIEEHFA